MTWAGSREEWLALIYEARRARWDPYSTLGTWEGKLVASRGDMNGKIVASKIRTRSSMLYDLMSFIRRYVVLTPDQLLVTALWVIHTHCVEAVDETPYLSVTSPERRCGKTRYLEILELFVHKPWICILPSEASVYRRLSKEHPVLMLDEVDTIYGKSTRDKYEGLRALLDSGSRRGVPVARAIGVTSRVELFDVFGPKVLAGIGALPDTVADRSIPIRLKRRRADEAIERFRRRLIGPEVGVLRDQIVAWAADHIDDLDGVQVDDVKGLHDRAMDACECLMAIADELGVGTEARASLVTLFTVERADDMQSLRTKLLRDLRAVFEKEAKRRGVQRGQVRALSTDDVLFGLCAIRESPWGNWYSRTFEARDLAGFLEHFGVAPRVVKVSGRAVRGYRHDDLSDVWERYA